MTTEHTTRPSTRVEVEGFSLNTEIGRLDPSKVASPLPAHSFVADESVPLFLTGELIEELNGKEPQPVSFESAGPRASLYFDPSKVKCAIVTCGGLCPGINDVIRAIVMEACHKYRAASVLGIRYGLEGFIPKYGHDVVELTPAAVSEIHQFGGTVLGSSRGPQDPAEVVDALERMNVNVLFMIGGDGTMKAAAGVLREVERRGLKIAVIGIPKTIDNDIHFITQSFGFETAVFKATEAIQCAHTEALGYKNGLGIVKLMGRESGFIAAHAALAMKDVNFVLIPEVPFALHGRDGLLEALGKRLAERAHAVLVVAEGAGAHLMQTDGARDSSGNPALGDVAELLKKEIKKYLGQQGIPYYLKYIDPSYIIRSVPANANDKVYCGFLGQYAVHAAMAGRTGMVAAKLMDRFVHLPLELVTRKRRKLNVRSEYWRAVLESTGQPELALA